MTNTKKTINLGIVAHVDAGKTTLTEQMLFQSGIVRNPGNVDKGTATTDWLPIEKARGISVRNASVSFEWKGVKINLIDTPGHIDFSSEVERTLPVLDAAILMLSAVEGVQAHTENLWHALRKLKIPTLIFINKLDRMGADSQNVIAEIKKELNAEIIPLQKTLNEASDAFNIKTKWDLNQAGNLDEKITEVIAYHDDALLKRYLDGEAITGDVLKTSLKQQINTSKIFPITFGSARNNIGVKELLDIICAVMPTANGNPDVPLSAYVFKVDHDKLLGKVASVRLFNGVIRTKDMVYNHTRGTTEKTNQMRELLGAKHSDVNQVTANGVAAIAGLHSVKAGDILGIPPPHRSISGLPEPMLTVKVIAENQTQYGDLVSALQILGDEDPTLDVAWLPDERELHIKIIGLIQLEILESILTERFQLAVSFEKPTVIYKETPSVAFEAFEEYTMPKPCWAVVLFKIEPGLPNSGVVFSSTVGVNKIAASYQKEIERTIPIALRQGNYGWEVTDVRITLIDGEHHNIHSRAGDFAVATPMAIMRGLQKAGTTLLEPIYTFTIKAPENLLGKIVSGLMPLRAEIGTPVFANETFVLTGKIPLATSLDYAAKLSSITGGRGNLKMVFFGYSECPVELGESIPYRGINPLDRAKYILKARNAIQ